VKAGVEDAVILSKDFLQTILRGFAKLFIRENDLALCVGNRQ
jgi:hypothetical protein